MSERILLIGGSTSGKSHNWIQIARLCEKMRRDTRFYVIDSDNSIMDQAESLIASGRIIHRVPYSWKDYTEAVREWLPGPHGSGLVRPSDWFIVDMMDCPWEMVQDWYVVNVLKTTMAKLNYDFQASNQKNAGKSGTDVKKRGGNPLLEHFAAGINPAYFEWQSSFLPRNPCHVLCTAPAVKVSDDDNRGFKDEQSLLNIFMAEGLKPKGQSRMPHNFNTIQLVEQRKRGVHTITTLRERHENRQDKKFDREILDDYAKQYLMQRAGWRP